MFDVGDRVHIHRPHTSFDGATGEIVRIDVVPPTPGVASPHLPISRLFTVRLDDGTLVEPPLLVSDLDRLPR
ncbi:MAG: hypothetical protein KY392_06220 [Chloroflexi bacterium]|nr:hypothetical protein [Chloroflexota bacterium]